MNADTLKAKLDESQYIYDDALITTLLVALKLGRPLLIEGAAEGNASDGVCLPSFWNTPSARFQQLKEATEARLAQSQPAPAE